MKNHKLPQLHPKEEITPALSLITDAYMAIVELKGRLTIDVMNPSLIIRLPTSLSFDRPVNWEEVIATKELLLLI